MRRDDTEHKPAWHVLTLDSWDAFLERADTGESSLSDSSRESRSHNSLMQEFTQVDSFPEAMTLAREGWPEGMRRVKDITERLINSISNQVAKQVWHHDMEGPQFDFGRWMAGDPECFLIPTTQRVEGQDTTKAVRLVMNCAVSCGIDTDAIVGKGAAVAALVDLLEYAGVAVEITLVARQSGVEVWVPVKPFHEPLDGDRLIFTMAHPATLRRLMFSVEETLPPAVVEGGGFHGSAGYGYPEDVMAEDRGDIYIGSNLWMGHAGTEDGYRAWVIQQLERQHVLIKEAV